MGGAKSYTFGHFSTTSRLNGEYLWNETRYRQSYKGVGNYTRVSLQFYKKFMNFGPQTA